MTDTSHLQILVDILKREVAEKEYIDVGENIERDLPVSRHEFDTALSMLKQEGYPVHIMKVQHMDNPDKDGIFKVLVAPGTGKKDVFINRMNIRLPDMTP